MKTEAVVLIALLAAFYSGWIFAHATISTECKRIGGFYVGHNVFVCQKKGHQEVHQ